MNQLKKTTLAMVSILALSGLASAGAEAGRFDLGLRMNVVAASGKPTNDILSQGLFGHYRLNDRWSLGFSLDHSSEFDVERAPTLVGLTTPEVVDAVGKSTAVTAWMERVYSSPAGRWDRFWSLGLGVNSVDVADLQGPNVDGTTYDLRTDAGTEFLTLFSLGARRWFPGAWAIEATLRADQHFSDWTITDRITGNTTTIDDYLATGIHFALLKRF